MAFGFSHICVRDILHRRRHRIANKARTRCVNVKREPVLAQPTMGVAGQNRHRVIADDPVGNRHGQQPIGRAYRRPRRRIVQRVCYAIANAFIVGLEIVRQRAFARHRQLRRRAGEHRGGVGHLQRVGLHRRLAKVVGGLNLHIVDAGGAVDEQPANLTRIRIDHQLRRAGQQRIRHSLTLGFGRIRVRDILHRRRYRIAYKARTGCVDVDVIDRDGTVVLAIGQQIEHDPRDDTLGNVGQTHVDVPRRRRCDKLAGTICAGDRHAWRVVDATSRLDNQQCGRRLVFGHTAERLAVIGAQVHLEGIGAVPIRIGLVRRHPVAVRVQVHDCEAKSENAGRHSKDLLESRGIFVIFGKRPLTVPNGPVAPHPPCEVWIGHISDLEVAVSDDRLRIPGIARIGALAEAVTKRRAREIAVEKQSLFQRLELGVARTNSMVGFHLHNSKAPKQSRAAPGILEEESGLRAMLRPAYSRTATSHYAILRAICQEDFGAKKRLTGDLCRASIPTPAGGCCAR